MALDSGIGENIGVIVELRMIFVYVKYNCVIIELGVICFRIGALGKVYRCFY